MVALWYRYRDGYFECATWAKADVVTYLRNDSEVAFEVSVNEPPYRGVRGNGSVGLSRDEDEALLGDRLERYLGGTDSEVASWPLSPERGALHPGPTAPGVQLGLHRADERGGRGLTVAAGSPDFTSLKPLG